MEIQTQVFFTEGTRQKLFTILVSPSTKQYCKAMVIFIPALWDEMNHSRHLVAAQARFFAREGIATLILDPEGTGDSYGESSSANWDVWLEDYLNVKRQLSAKYKIPIIFWGMRAGALLAGELHSRSDSAPAPLLLWNPVFDGELVLREMLRIQLTSLMMGSTHSTSMQRIRAELDNGDTVNLAGYDVSGMFASKLASQKLVDTIPNKSTVVWIDVVRHSIAKSPPAVMKTRKQLEEGESKILYSTVEGPPFWQSVELESVPDLLTMTCKALQNAMQR